MNSPASPSASWAATPFGDPADPLAKELKALGAHFVNCQQSRGRWFELSSAFELVHAFVAPRFVTTLVAATVVIGVGALVF